MEAIELSLLLVDNLFLLNSFDTFLVYSSEVLFSCLSLVLMMTVLVENSLTAKEVWFPQHFIARIILLPLYLLILISFSCWWMAPKSFGRILWLGSSICRPFNLLSAPAVVWVLLSWNQISHFFSDFSTILRFCGSSLSRTTHPVVRFTNSHHIIGMCIFIQLQE